MHLLIPLVGLHKAVGQLVDSLLTFIYGRVITGPDITSSILVFLSVVLLLMDEDAISAVLISPLTFDLDRREATLLTACIPAFVLLLVVPDSDLPEAGLDLLIPLLHFLVAFTVLLVSGLLFLVPAPLWVLPCMTLALLPSEFVLRLLLALLHIEALRLCQDGWGLEAERGSGCSRADQGDGEASNSVPHC